MKRIMDTGVTRAFEGLFFLIAFGLFLQTPTFISSEANAQDCEGQNLVENAASKFGEKIQNIVRSKDKLAFLSLWEGELDYGPRREFIKTHSFDELFSMTWQRMVLESPPPCTSVGNGGFMLGSGMIWFSMTTNGFVIFSLNNVVDEPPINVPVVGWYSHDAVLLPDCFTYEWASSDNFEQFHRQFNIQNYADFSVTPGMFLNREIDTLDAIVPEWCKPVQCDPDDPYSKVALVQFLSQCSAPRNSVNIQDGFVTMDIGNGLKDRYQVLGKMDISVCQKLAPSIKGRCREAFLIEREIQSRGSLGSSFVYGGYGLFALDDGRAGVVPLVYFPTVNQIRSYLDTGKFPDWIHVAPN
jgi:hypothetical protein